MKLICTIWCLCLPLKRIQVTSLFGYRVNPVTGFYSFHSGVDIRAKGDTIYAILNGHVSVSRYDPLLGLNVQIEHIAVQSIYGHLSQVFVLPGDSITAGQPLGITGATGRVTGEHLHFAIRYHQRYIDPLQFLYELLIKKEDYEQKF